MQVTNTGGYILLFTIHTKYVATSVNQLEYTKEGPGWFRGLVMVDNSTTGHQFESSSDW